MMFTGQPVSAAEAWRLGLVDEVIAENLVDVARALAVTVAAKSPLGLRSMKRTLNRIECMPFEEGYLIEQQENAVLRETDDAREASQAAIEKRAPVFRGR